MKKTKLIVGLLVVAGCITAIAASKKNPVLMTVNGKAVTLSEFEYMYHKNNQQQVAEQPLEQYLEMFKTYKLKVADAEAAGIDTTAAFIKEYNGYRNELAMPYLKDTVVEENLRKQIYEHMKYNVLASHVMLPLGKDDAENDLYKNRLDSLRQRIIAGEPFDSIALKYSVDPSVKRNGGSQGYVAVGRFPYQFEDVVYTTPIGEVSEPFTTPFGWHIVKTFDRQPDAGKVLVGHILKMYPQGADEAAKAAIAAKVDSLYNLVIEGADFEELARKESEDRGSARKGGKLPYFGKGEMVPEFEKVSFELKPGEVSKPFATRYGVHFVKKYEDKPLGSYAECRDQLSGYVESRGDVAIQSKVEQLKKQYKFSLNNKVVNRLKGETQLPDSLDTAFIERCIASTETLFTLDGKKYPVSLLGESLKGMGRATGSVAIKIIDEKINSLVRTTVLNYEKDMLEKNNADFGNLVREYRDGMLLFEISNRNVWEKATTDTEGLKTFFEANRSNYRWDTPKDKGYLIETTSDSITSLVKAELATVALDTMAQHLRKTFSKDVKITRVLAAKGENAKIDSEVFGAAKVKSEGRFVDYFVFGGKLIAKPEEVADVRGAVVADYQNYLEQQWIDTLRGKYPIWVDKKVLNMVK